MGKFQFWLPTVNKLTRIQRRAIDSRKPIFLTGVPGSGKTVVSIYRLLNSKNGILFTYGKLLRKTIEEKVNDDSKQIVNIHRWLYDIIGGDLDKNFSDYNIENTIGEIQSRNINYDEILVDEGQDLLPNSYKLFDNISPKVSVSADEAQKVNNPSEASNEVDILEKLPSLRKVELDEIFRSSYELYNFARQFVPNNARANDRNLLAKLKEENSGADKPFLYIVDSRSDSNDVMMEIVDDNPTDNIGILCESILAVEEHTQYLRNEGYDVSSYHSGYRDVSTDLHNIIVTTFKSAKGIEFDIVIMPYFQSLNEKSNTELFVGVTRAKSQVHMISILKRPKLLNGFGENTYDLVDRRGNQLAALDELSNTNKTDFDEILKDGYEAWNFLKKFLPNDTQENDKEINKSISRKPSVHLVDWRSDSNELIKKIIDKNLSNTVGILCESSLCVDEHFKELKKKDYDVGAYDIDYSNPAQELSHITVTTFKSIKNLEFDIVIMPYFQDAKAENNMKYSLGVSSAKNEIHMICIQKKPKILNEFDKDDYEEFDERVNREDV